MSHIVNLNMTVLFKAYYRVKKPVVSRGQIQDHIS